MTLHQESRMSHEGVKQRSARRGDAAAVVRGAARASLAAWLGALALAALGGGCVEDEAGISGVQSLRVALTAPASPGSEAMRLPDTLRQVSLDISSIDASGELDSTLSGDLDVHVQFLGSLTPALDSPVPLTRLRMTSGRAAGTVTLPPVFGPTVLWVEHSSGADATYATGTSPKLWFRDPTISDISTPSDELGLGALASSPLELKQVRVASSRYGERGRLIVTSVYSQGYTVSDVQCQDAAGTPPCTAAFYDHVTIFTFGAPRDERGNEIKVGMIIPGFTGGVTEFNGLTELGFPQTFARSGEPEITPARLPEPRVLELSWFTQRIEFERIESGLLKVNNVKVCPLDDDYTTFKQWKLDVGRGCSGDVINVVTAGVVDFDPAGKAGMTLGSVVGALRPINIGSFNVWIIYPRSNQDITQ
jgi:hypothetical protein